MSAQAITNPHVRFAADMIIINNMFQTGKFHQPGKPVFDRLTSIQSTLIAILAQAELANTKEEKQRLSEQGKMKSKLPLLLKFIQDNIGTLEQELQKFQAQKNNGDYWVKTTDYGELNTFQHFSNKNTVDSFGSPGIMQDQLDTKILNLTTQIRELKELIELLSLHCAPSLN